MNVVVDDRDAAVQYTPAWRTEGLGRPIEFQSTTSNPASPGDSAVFSFSGTSVEVFATLAGGSGSSLSFSIDDGAATVFPVAAGTTTTAHHQQIFTSGTLPDGPHTLSMVAGGSAISQIFLDYFLVRTADVAGKDVFIDDSEGGGAGIVYSPTGWGVTQSEEHFESSLHVGEAGAWVAVTFQGTQLTLRGPYTAGANGESVRASASVDGGVPIALVPRTGGADAGETTLNNVLFASPSLTQGTHTVNITVAADSPLPLQVDYFLVNSDAGEDAAAEGGIAGATGAATQSTAGASLSPLLSPSPVAGASTTSSAPQLNKAALIAGVIAGVLFLLLLIVAGILVKRRRARKARRSSFTTNSSFFPGIATWAAKTVPGPGPERRETMMSAAPPYTRESTMQFGDVEKQEQPSRYLHWQDR
ncbi:hypothetical protein MKEN_00207600 [Mycena kentingensis (nom. inval.)]|nr:hypothetical protein MKEN_00207600 [Mycena kentingensis (nom. inval.)]